MVVNISIEDLDPKFDNLDLLHRIVNNFPEIKIDLFIPCNSNWRLAQWRKMKPGWTNNILKHPEWCRKIAVLPDKNFEIAVHGYYHQSQDAALPEFLHLDKMQAKERLLLCEQAFGKAGIPFVRGFRPPKWECSEGTIEALEELNYLFYAPDPRSVDEAPSSSVIPQIFFNTSLDGKVEIETPHPKNKYCLIRGHYQLADWALTICYKYLIPFLKDLQQKEKLEFKFYTEIARDIKNEQTEIDCLANLQ